jgi:hypothetical protein
LLAEDGKLALEGFDRCLVEACVDASAGAALSR